MGHLLCTIIVSIVVYYVIFVVALICVTWARRKVFDFIEWLSKRKKSNMKTTTLREIINHNPYKDALEKLLKGLKYPTEKEYLTKKQLDAKLSTRFILENNGIKDAVWALRIFAGTPDWHRFKADVAEFALPVFERKNPFDERPKEAIQAARDFADGEISKEELEAVAEVATKAAIAAYDTANCNNMYADYTARVYAGAEAARAAEAACDCDTSASYTANCAFTANCAYADADRTQEEIIKILLKYI